MPSPPMKRGSKHAAPGPLQFVRINYHSSTDGLVSKAVRKEANTQTKVGVGIEAFWKALAKDVRLLTPIVLPKLVKEIEVIEGDGGFGTVYFFHLCSDVPVKYQKEKIVDFDESLHQFGLEVIEGRHLTIGFSYYKIFYQLTATTESETLIDIKVIYETEADETLTQVETRKLALAYIKLLEDHLLSQNLTVAYLSVMVMGSHCYM
ncbi:hypothetical protein RJ639_047851 [Escallonia herrerae]|uniref:Bet v I/Major latex protein domain-containing protein n=1 Tax=Escallonia herrerae TaxID=1293975 RepID=A0AA88WDB8_9ASTE|nr:hypothetical protein RJ639_047851 [Escallonia herrerae]